MSTEHSAALIYLTFLSTSIFESTPTPSLSEAH